MKVKKYKAKGFRQPLEERKGKIKPSQVKVGEMGFFFPRKMKTISASSLREATNKLRKE